jgi:hypothetical protein
VVEDWAEWDGEKRIELGGDSDWNGVERLVLQRVSGVVVVVDRLVLDSVDGVARFMGEGWFNGRRRVVWERGVVVWKRVVCKRVVWSGSLFEFEGSDWDG